MNTMSNPCGFLLWLLHSAASALLLAVAAAPALLLAVAAAQEGFLSIDCGFVTHPTYQSEIKLDYVSDSKFISNGMIKQLDPGRLPNNVPLIYRTLRYFPVYKRNCYNLPVSQGTNYLVRACFMYGNYDGSNKVPSFDIYLGVDHWETVKLDNATHMHWTEIFSTATTATMSVCLVNTSMGVPFISGLELRPLSGTKGYQVSANSSLVTFRRINLGETAPLRYPDDPYDRIWTPGPDPYLYNGTAISSTVTLKDEGEPQFGLPSAVLKTAINSSSPIPVTWSGQKSDAYHVVLEFAEILPPTGQRILAVQLNGYEWIKPFTLAYRDVMAVFSIDPLPRGQHSFSVEANGSSDYGPILNAFEIYRFVQPGGSATFSPDVLAIEAVQDYYQIKKNWNADPCLPLYAPWEGLTCNSDNQSSPRIETLDLSNGGLSGAISFHLSRLTALRKLNLSKNNIHGSLPSFLEDMPYLSDIDLSSNNLSGPIPTGLKQKAANGVLTLRIGDNPQICQQYSCNQGNGSDRKRSLIVIISVASSSVVAAGIILSILVFIRVNLKRTRRENNQERKSARAIGNICVFTYDEVVEITSNFERVIGKGGSCTVFYGRLRDGREVAVKLITGRFSQGIREYKAEVELLMKVHHKCLVSFLGFCEEDQKMVLVYEYMKKGDLQMLLSDETETSEILDWRQRLQIAHSVATGLEYLHVGCKPPIIHRDVKTRNVLLNDKFEAKIADFGLSKIRIADETSHVSTVVAGTPGYIDPEYYTTNKLTEKSDVYSFGVVLFELITGQNAILTQGSRRVHSLEVVMPKIMRGDVASIVDRRLQGQYDINSVWKAAETAIACTAEKGTTRPTMTEVVRELKEAIDIENHQLESKSQSMEWASKLPSTCPGLLDMDSFTHPAAR